ncbi:MAG TPA: TonB-dependent receptor [Opitutaceae bacterium]|nr:TonB-dependent receptor [Opitutaceae bacterium]
MQLPTRILPSLAGIFLPLALPAQPANPPVATAEPAKVTLEPLIVTADLWAPRFERLAASVSVFDTSDLQARSVRHFGDLVEQVPNLTYTGGTSRPRYFQIRGIGENSQYEGETPDSAVRFVVDDFDFTGLGSLAGTFDVSQVEVLRGPQAGAFGANAAGGVIRLVTQAPTSFWTGRIESSLGEDGLREGGFAVGGPLVRDQPQKLMMRLAVHQHVSDGFRRNVTLNRDTNARDELSARLRLTWNPSAEWRWEGAALVSQLNNGFDDFALDNNGRLTYSDQPGRDEQDSIAGSLRGTFQGWQSARLTSVSSGSWVDSTYSYDDDWTAGSYEGFSRHTRERSVFNQELRLDSTRPARGVDRWTLGAFFSRLDEDTAYTNTDPGNIRGLVTRYEAVNAALFGQIAHRLSARTRVVLGLRWETLDVNGTGTRTRFRASRNAYDPVVTFSPAFDDSLVGGKVSLEHQLTEHHFLFGSITRGYKGGAVNIDARINPLSDPTVYDTEHLWNYEAGVRGSWLEQRLRADVTVFHLVRTNTQVRDSAGFGGSYRFFTDNANDARVTGLEASAAFALTPAWSLEASIARMDSTLDRFVLGNGNAGGGRELANTPRHGATAGIRYRPAQGIFGSIDWVNRARQFDSNNQNEARRPFSVVNASLGFAWRNWTLTVWGRNLTDKAYDQRVFFFGNEDPDYLETRYESRAAPRQWGVTAAYGF